MSLLLLFGRSSRRKPTITEAIQDLISIQSTIGHQSSQLALRTESMSLTDLSKDILEYISEVLIINTNILSSDSVEVIKKTFSVDSSIINDLNIISSEVEDLSISYIQPSDYYYSLDPVLEISRNASSSHGLNSVNAKNRMSIEETKIL